MTLLAFLNALNQLIADVIYNQNLLSRWQVQIFNMLNILASAKYFINIKNMYLFNI